jgi:hypothetical protein
MSNTCETFEHCGFVIEIDWDSDPTSPRKWDNAGRMVCWHRRYNLGDWEGKQRNPQHSDGTEFSDPSEFNEWWQTNGKGGIILPLYLYDHSGITMSCGPFACPWDSGQVGYIYITSEDIRKNWNCKRITSKIRKQAEDCLRSEVSVYDDYLTGQVYCYTVFELLPESEECEELEDRKGEHLDSCCGFYGLDYCRTEAKSAAEHLAKTPAYSI